MNFVFYYANLFMFIKMKVANKPCDGLTTHPLVAGDWHQYPHNLKRRSAQMKIDGRMAGWLNLGIEWGVYAFFRHSTHKVRVNI